MKKHVSVLLDEAIAQLNIKHEGTYIDATFGRGGHTKQILAKLNKNSNLILIDKDIEAIKFANKLASEVQPKVKVCHTSFKSIFEIVQNLNLIGAIDGIIMDLGVSSPQIDDANRGFSFSAEGPLDMRMDQSCGQSAAEWLENASETEIADVLYKYGQERKSRKIAAKIVATRKEKPIQTTTQLVEIIKSVIPWQPNKNPATRTFQAIRIFINQELHDLSVALEASIQVLKPKGRLVVISFHSLEDSIVKNFINKYSKAPANNSKLPIEVKFVPKLKKVGKFFKPSEEECSTNIRARSAIMRVAEVL